MTTHYIASGQSGYATSPPRHKTVSLRHGGLTAQIDEGLAELIQACWAAGIETGESCQEIAPGMARIGFLGLSDMEHFYDVLNDSIDDVLFYGWNWTLWADGGLQGTVYFPAERIPWVTQRLQAFKPAQDQNLPPQPRIEQLRHMSPAEMTDQEFLELREYNYLRTDRRFPLLEFMGMTREEYTAWKLDGVIPERTMRANGRRPV